jgi:protein TonB
MKNTVKLTLLSLLLAVPAWADSKPEAPVPVRTVEPVFPEELREKGVSGLVYVKCTVDAQGNVHETSVEKSTNPAFEKPAMEAVQRWKFKPARQDGNPVAIRVSIPIKFVVQS